jgi:hypothetical protein
MRELGNLRAEVVERKETKCDPKKRRSAERSFYSQDCHNNRDCQTPRFFILEIFIIRKP